MKCCSVNHLPAVETLGGLPDSTVREGHDEGSARVARYQITHRDASTYHYEVLMYEHVSALRWSVLLQHSGDDPPGAGRGAENPRNGNLSNEFAIQGMRHFILMRHILLK